jgi:catechol 2,3-dioxygenase-like lactoylglutathione lyase family enzyme
MSLTMSSSGSIRQHHMATTVIAGVITVAVPVSDQDAAKSIFEQLGLETRTDSELQPGFRWIELGFPNGGATISLVAAGPELPAGIDTGVRLATPDARAAHKTIRDLGLDAGELLDWETAPLMFSFVDPDGNRFYVTEMSPD